MHGVFSPFDGNGEKTMKIKTVGNAVMVAALILSSAPCSQAAEFTIWLANDIAGGVMSNSIYEGGAPYLDGARDASWDIGVATMPSLGDFGAAMLNVRMVTFNLNANSRTMNSASGPNGLAIAGGGQNLWIDGSTGEAAAFKFTFYSDTNKTSEITGLDITFKSFIARIHSQFGGLALNAFAGPGALTLSSSDDAGVVSIGGTTLTMASDGLNSTVSDVNLLATSSDFKHQQIDATGSLVFNESDVFWIRRQNNGGVADLAYQLGAISFELDAKITTIGPIALDLLPGTNALTLTWDTVAGPSYRLESKAGLLDASWTSNTTVVGTGGDVTVTTAVDQIEFYRVTNGQ